MNRITTEEWTRFCRLREDLFDQIKLCLEDDGHCKSYEGTFTISCRLPNYFQQRVYDESPEPEWVIGLAMYLINPFSRYKEWVGATFGEALEEAETEIRYWLELTKRFLNDEHVEEIDNIDAYNEGFNCYKTRVL